MLSWRPYPRFRGWWIVGVGFMNLYLNGAATSYLFSILVLPMQADLGWSRATLLGALTLATLVSAAVGMVIGPIFDKHGARAGMTVSALFSGIFLLLIPLVNSPWQFYALVGIGLGSTRSALDNVGPRTAIANWFIRRRAAAFAWFSGGRAVFAVTLALPECGEDADRGLHARAGVADGGGGLERRRVVGAGHGHRAAGRLRHHVEALGVGPGTGGTFFGITVIRGSRVAFFSKIDVRLGCLPLGYHD